MEADQSATSHHPDMGAGTTIARAGIQGSLSAAGGWGGAVLGAKVGAAVGASLGPLGIVAGSIVGGVLGGWLGGTIGDSSATFFNSHALSS